MVGDPPRQTSGGPLQSSLPVPPFTPQMVKPSVVPLKPTCVNSRNVPNRSTFGFWYTVPPCRRFLPGRSPGRSRGPPRPPAAMLHARIMPPRNPKMQDNFSAMLSSPRGNCYRRPITTASTTAAAPVRMTTRIVRHAARIHSSYRSPAAASTASRPPFVGVSSSHIPAPY